MIFTATQDTHTSDGIVSEDVHGLRGTVFFIQRGAISLPATLRPGSGIQPDTLICLFFLGERDS